MGLTKTATPSTNWALDAAPVAAYTAEALALKSISFRLNLFHRCLVLEHNKLAVVLKSGLKASRHLGQVRVTDVLAFLVDDTSTMGSSNEQAAFGDFGEEGVAITLLGKGLKLRIDLIPFLP